VREGLQVKAQVALGGSSAEPLCQIITVVAGKMAVTLLLGQVQNGCRAESPVQMVMEEYLGCLTDPVKVNLHVAA
tara:strand:+ start:75 stop:299 length:225 start_codon:yes stop_codon:yes gene_type:complete